MIANSVEYGKKLIEERDTETPTKYFILNNIFSKSLVSLTKFDHTYEDQINNNDTTDKTTYLLLEPYISNTIEEISEVHVEIINGSELNVIIEEIADFLIYNELILTILSSLTRDLNNTDCIFEDILNEVLTIDDIEGFSISDSLNYMLTNMINFRRNFKSRKWHKGVNNPYINLDTLYVDMKKTIILNYSLAVKLTELLSNEKGYELEAPLETLLMILESKRRQVVAV